jgi:hypothetical protein
MMGRQPILQGRIYFFFFAEGFFTVFFAAGALGA